MSVLDKNKQICRDYFGAVLARDTTGLQIRDGVLVEHWAQLDNLGMLKQLGAIDA